METLDSVLQDISNMKTLTLFFILFSVSLAQTQPDLSKLHNRISQFCPIDGVSIGSFDSKGSWRIDYKVSVTASQRSAAQSIVSTWTANDFLGTPTERRAVRYADECDKIAVSIVRYQILIDIESNPTKKAKFQAKLDAAKSALISKSQEIEAALPD